MIKAKKSLGQNFLIDQNIINKIVNLINVRNKYILEIGPGTGNLTSKLLDQLPKKLTVVEKDNKLANLLKKNLGTKISIINDDILKLDENNIESERLTVFGNLPYNISTEILCKWILDIKDQNYWFDCLMHRRKMIKKPYNQIFNGDLNIAHRLGIQLNQRPQNLDLETYFKLANEYEKLIG